MSRMAIEGISSDSIFEKIAELPWAAAPGPHHFARILDRGMKPDWCLEWLEKEYPQTPNFENSLSFQGLPRILNGLIHTTYWIKPKFNPQYQKQGILKI